MAERPAKTPEEISLHDIQRLHPKQWIGFHATQFNDRGEPLRGEVVTVGEREEVIVAYRDIDPSLLPYFYTYCDSSFSTYDSTGPAWQIIGGRPDKMLKPAPSASSNG